MKVSFGNRHSAATVHAAIVMLIAISATSRAQSSAHLLASRSDLTSAASQAERAATSGEPAQRTQNALTAAAIRQRLRDGDLQVGDRMVVTVISDAVHRDTVAVRADRSIELPGMIIIPVAGVLRSELVERISSEVLKYVKAERVEVTPLIRVGVLGAVARPGYFAIASDIPITDAIMVAGGLTGAADVGRTTIRRGSQEFRSAGETSKAMATGLTLDQFGLVAGDELVVGQQSSFGAGAVIGILGALASFLALAVSLHH